VVNLGRVIGASALALALGASAPCRALAQDSAQPPGAAAAQNAPAAEPGASIRKPPSGAADAAASAAAPSADATAGAPASVSAPAAIATPLAPAKAEAKARNRSKAKTRNRNKNGDKAAHLAHPEGVKESAAAKTDSMHAKAGSKDDKDSKGDQDSPFSSLQFSGNKGPIDIKSDALDLDYKGNVVTFRGHVRAVQADATLTSDNLTVTYGKDFHQIQEMVAKNNVRMSQGTRWATGDRAVLDQAKHTVTLTGSPVVHDGEDQVAGTKITVHLDTGKSEVEGARAVFFPKEQKTRDNKTTVAKSSAKSP
jgi:lipopolysaccharide export system protein LptA